MSGTSYSFSMESLYAPISGEYLAGQSLSHVSQKSSEDKTSLQFQSNAYWWFSIVSSDGTRDMSRWTVGDHIDRGHNSDTDSFTWFADRCWKLVYTNGENGEGLFGKRKDLVKEIESGKRVRVMTQDKTTGAIYITHADTTWVKNGHVTVQNLGHVSKTADGKHFQDNVYWYWQMKSTTGRIIDTRYNVGANTPRGTTTRKMKINWFVETRPMNLVFSHDKDGSSNSGSREDLVSSIKDGASVQIVVQHNQDEFSSFPAHNLALKSLPSGVHVAAQNVKHVSIQSTATNCFEYEIQSNPYFWFSIVTTQGDRDMIRYTVGTHDARGHNQDKVALDWFVNI